MRVFWERFITQTWGRILRFDRDIRLFMLFNLLAQSAIGVSMLVFNLYLKALGFREDYIGSFAAVQTLAAAAAALVMGRLLDRFGSWRTIFGGTLLLLGASLAVAWSSNGALLLLLAVFSGLGMSFLFTTTMPFIIEFARFDHRQDAAAVTFSLISLAVTLGSLVGGFVPTLLASGFGVVASEGVWAYRWAMLIGTLIAGAGLLPMLKMGAARQQKGRSRQQASAVVEEAADRRRARLDVLVFVTVAGLLAMGLGMVVPFYNVYLTSLGIGTGAIGLIYAGASLCAAVTGLFAPALGRRVGSLYAVFLVRISILPFVLLLIFAPSYGLAVAMHLVRQISISLAWPMDSTFIAEVLPARLRLSVYGIRSSVWNGAWALASMIGGWVIVTGGYDWTFAGLIICTVASAGLYFWYFGRHPKVVAGEIPSAVSRGARLAHSARAAAALVERQERSPAAGTGPAAQTASGQSSTPA